jgi:5-formyltetrahydrofolate cyclo-ligase
VSKSKSVRHDGKISAMDAIDQQKRDLRADLKLRRSGRHYDPDLAGLLCVQLAELCLSNGATKVACYLAYGDEPDTELFIDWALENEIEVVVPVSNPDGTLNWVKFEGETELGIFGFAEPVGQPASLSDADLIFIPAMAVDRKGQRLGKGKGYYDRALSAFERVPPVIAVVFDDELIEAVPTEAHDHPVDAVVTPSNTTRFTDRLN